MTDRKLQSPQGRVVKREDAKDLAGSALSTAADALLHSRIGIITLVLVALVVFGGLFDAVANGGRAYSGVYVGDVDVGGMTEEEIARAVAEGYEGRLSNGDVVIYASQDALERHETTEEYGDEVTVEEEIANRVSWSTNAESLQAYIDYDDAAAKALAVGRDNPADRLSLMLGTVSVDVPVNFNEALLESLASDIDRTIGKPLVDFDVAVELGEAVVVDGEDGDMIDRDVFANELASKFLSDDIEGREFVAHSVYTPVHIDQAAAQSVADAINKAISSGITFTCDTTEWHADPFTLGTWIQTKVEKNNDGSYALVPSVSVPIVRQSILENIPPTFEDGEGSVSFAKSSDRIQVNVSSSGTFPLLADAIQSVNSILFSSDSGAGEADRLHIELKTEQLPRTMTLDQALSYGVVMPVSEFTTLYTTGAEARNVNIHLASDLINNSIIKADGGQWSFNDTAGECNEAKGFQAATAIAGGTKIDEIGGGICQVATTVFNAVYQAGYPIDERYNHSLYIASYPQGRDAAISWPSPDLKWSNDTSSDLLLQMTYTDSSVTATLYGVDAGYIVESEEGAWVEGAAFSTTYEYDDTLPSGTEYVKTNGSNGHSITVTRTVKDSEGETIRTDVFTSLYNPEDTVIVRGSA